MSTHIYIQCHVKRERERESKHQLTWGFLIASGVSCDPELRYLSLDVDVLCLQGWDLETTHNSQRSYDSEELLVGMGS
jgi:hypothetical protein